MGESEIVMRDWKSLVACVAGCVGLLLVNPLVSIAGLAIIVVWVIEARQDARHRYNEEATVQRMAVHVEAVLAEAEELRDQAKADAAIAKALREETERQLVQQFASWQAAQMRPSPEELFDQYQLERIDREAAMKFPGLLAEIEEHLKDV